MLNNVLKYSYLTVFKSMLKYILHYSYLTVIKVCIKLIPALFTGFTFAPFFFPEQTWLKDSIATLRYHNFKC